MPTIAVTNANDSGPGSLRQAVVDAMPGDTIIFDSEVSLITLTSGGLLINKTLTFNGPGAEQLAIDGNLQNRIFLITSGVEVTITGISLTKGHAGSSGGAIYNEGKVNINNCRLSHNEADSAESFSTRPGGGAIYNRGTVNLANCSLSYNKANRTIIQEAYGGAIVNLGGKVNITNTTLHNNSVGYPGVSGGIYSLGGTVDIQHSMLSNHDSAIWMDGGSALNVSNCTLSHNIGGAIILYSEGKANITNSTLSHNSTNGIGGAIVNSGTVIIQNSTVSNNSARGEADIHVGGGAIFNGGTANISNSTLSGNTCEDAGGAIHNVGTINVINTTLSKNTSGTSGGAIENGWSYRPHSSKTNLSFSTIAENKASNGAGINNNSQSTMAFKNSIVANNDGPNCSGPGNISTFGVNFTTDGTCPGFTEVNPSVLKLGPLALNPPGKTETHVLLKGSVAIDAVMDCTDLNGNPVTTDQRGVSRPQGRACDAGTYEARVIPVVIAQPLRTNFIGLKNC